MKKIGLFILFITLIGCEQTMESKEIQFSVEEKGTYYAASNPFENTTDGIYEVQGNQVRIDVAADGIKVEKVMNQNDETIIFVQSQRTVTAIPETTVSFLVIAIDDLKKKVSIEEHEGDTFK